MNPSTPDDRNDAPRSCEEFSEDLSHFVLDELDDARRPALEQHLVACAACRAERDLLVRSVERVKAEASAAAPILELSAERRAELLNEAAGGAKVVVLTRHRWNLPRVAAAAVVVGGLGLGSMYWWKNTRGCDFEVAQGDGLAGRNGLYRGPADAVPPFAAAATPFDLESAEVYRISEDAASSDQTGVPVPAEPTIAVDSLDLAGAGLSTNPAAPSAAPDSGDLSEKRMENIHLTPEQLRVMTKQKNGEALSPEEMKVVRRARKDAREAKRPNAAPAVSEASVPAQTEEQELNALGYVGSSGGGGGGSTSQQPVVEGEEELARLRKLGYQAGEAGPPQVAAAAPSFTFSARQQLGTYLYAVQPPVVDPAAIACALALTNAPTDILALQPQLAGAIGFDPSKPMDADAGRNTDAVIREFLDQLAPRQGETPRDMFFRYFGDHSFVSTRIDPKSTFGMDVDTASYNLVRAYLTKGNLPPKAAVRTEEFVNAFRHELAPPAADGAEVFAIHTELAPSPFGEDGQLLLQIGLKAREVSKSARRPVALTFVIDVSGSMEEGGRLELVKRSLMRLVGQLDERDTIGIVTFSTDARRVLDPTNAAHRATIASTLDKLRPDGSTNADAGLRLGYDMALEQLRSNAENRVILCSDGVANTGVTDVNWLVRRIQDCKSRNLYLNCIGVGMNNHNDALLEQLADEGDGFCAYVDRDEEAKEIFVDRLSGTLITVARNAKIQVEFDDHSVRRFRQLGYENRALEHRDFRNDKVDAGEVGAGHEVIALYELELKPGAVGPLATVRCRYEEPRSREVIEQAREVFVAEQHAAVRDATPRFRLSMAVAEFAEILRQSIHARSGSLADVQRFAEPLVAELPGDDDVPEFVALVKQAARLPDLLPRRTDLVRAVDEIKRFRCLREEIQRSDAAKDAANDELMRQMEEQNRKLEQALRDALERAARGS